MQMMPHSIHTDYKHAWCIHEYIHMSRLLIRIVSTISVTIVTPCGPLNICKMHVRTLMHTISVFQLLGRVVRYAYGWLAATTA